MRSVGLGGSFSLISRESALPVNNVLLAVHAWIGVFVVGVTMVNGFDVRKDVN